MIKLESAHIEELRGIRKIDIELGSKTFAVSGPNGSGKSGIIDAIEFGLTGRIGRLTGRGTKDLSLADHGPHIDKRSFPDAAFVRLRVHIPVLGKSATITRKVSAPRKPKIEPADADIRKALDEVAEHPEITLSRREILRFILAEPAKRSEEIQTLLKLESIGETRATLKTALNKLQSASSAADSQVRTSREALQRHLQVTDFQASTVLGAVNVRRQALGLPAISALTAETRLDDGLAAAAEEPVFNKQSALRDLDVLAAEMAEAGPTDDGEATTILTALRRLETDPALLVAIQQRALIEKGLELVDGPDCPLCDSPFDDEDHLRGHLETKLVKSRDAATLQAMLLAAGMALGRRPARLCALIADVAKAASSQGDVAARQVLDGWAADLGELRQQLSNQDGLMGLKRRLEEGWPRIPAALIPALAALKTRIKGLADQSAMIDAQTFVATAQMRLDDYRGTKRRLERAMAAAKAAKAAYDTYCLAMEAELDTLYQAVQDDFTTYYKALNETDEIAFTAKLKPTAGALDLSVNFYERGLFPPGAFHSEGHQDGMGVCLYLALMKHLFGDRFTIALLDDVVMSVDAGHRLQFCKLLKTHFPQTQFVITTHDRLWARQMASAGLVSRKTSLVFHSWHVETGPIVASDNEIWADIAAALAEGNMVAAAAGLRNHLEYITSLLADQIGAQTVFRADGGYELGDLLPSVLTRMSGLCGKAAEAAQSWGSTEAHAVAVARRNTLSDANRAAGVEQWAINKTVHYNEWANFGRTDFTPVVSAFKTLLGCFQCEECKGWLHVSPRVQPENVRCPCAKINMNLTPRPKDT